MARTYAAVGSIALALVVVGSVLAAGSPASLLAQQGQQDECETIGLELLVKFEAQGGSFAYEKGDEDAVTISNVQTDEDGEPISFDWTSTAEVETVRIKAGQETEQFAGGTSGTVDPDTPPAISNVVFCVDGEPTPTPEPTETPTEQPPTGTPTEQPPTEQPPTEQPPTEQPPTEQPPTEQPPTEQPPTEQPPTEQPPEVTYYQVDFVVGEPKPELGPDVGFYSDEGRLVRYAHGNSEDGLTRTGSVGSTQPAVAACLADVDDIAVDDGRATITFTVEEGCEQTFTLASYEKADGTFDRDETQTLHDSATDRFGSGTHAVTVALPPDDADAATALGANVGGLSGVAAAFTSAGVGFALVTRRD